MMQIRKNHITYSIGLQLLRSSITSCSEILDAVKPSMYNTSETRKSGLGSDPATSNGGRFLLLLVGNLTIVSLIIIIFGEFRLKEKEKGYPAAVNQPVSN